MHHIPVHRASQLHLQRRDKEDRPSDSNLPQHRHRRQLTQFSINKILMQFLFLRVSELFMHELLIFMFTHKACKENLHTDIRHRCTFMNGYVCCFYAAITATCNFYEHSNVNDTFIRCDAYYE